MTTEPVTPSPEADEDLVATARRIGCTLAIQLADEIERLRSAAPSSSGEAQRVVGQPPWVDADEVIPSTDRYLPIECFVAGALSTMPPFTTYHPGWMLPFARQAIEAMGEWEPDDADTPMASGEAQDPSAGLSGYDGEDEIVGHYVLHPGCSPDCPLCSVLPTLTATPIDMAAAWRAAGEQLRRWGIDLEREAEADADIAAGRVSRAYDMNDPADAAAFFADLDGDAQDPPEAEMVQVPRAEWDAATQARQALSEAAGFTYEPAAEHRFLVAFDTLAAASGSGEGR